MSNKVFFIGVGKEGMEMGLDVSILVTEKGKKQVLLNKLKTGEAMPEEHRMLSSRIHAMELRARMNGHRSIEFYTINVAENITMDDLYELFSEENLPQTRPILEEKGVLYARY